jgi:putative tricarboxylic transport membrane protein
MKVGDRVFGLISLGLSVWLIIEAGRYDYLTEFTPGPGFAPLWVGIILGLFSLFLIYQSLSRKGSKEDDIPILPGRSSLVRVGYIVLILAVFTALMMSLGFLLAAWGFVFFLLYFLEDYSILKSVSYSMLFSALSFFVFRYWMEVDLPKGWLGF